MLVCVFVSVFAMKYVCGQTSSGCLPSQQAIQNVTHVFEHVFADSDDDNNGG